MPHWTNGYDVKVKIVVTGTVHVRAGDDEQAKEYVAEEMPLEDLIDMRCAPDVEVDVTEIEWTGAEEVR